MYIVGMFINVTVCFEETKNIGNICVASCHLGVDVALQNQYDNYRVCANTYRLKN